MIKKIKEGILLGIGFIFTIIFFLGVVWAVGFHSANEITSGTFSGTYDFSSATITGLDIVNTTYSLDEVNTGKKWINGKPIYRNIINSTISAYTSSVGYVEFENVLNSEEIIDWGGNIESTSGWIGGLPYNNGQYDSYLLKSTSNNLITAYFAGTNYASQWAGQPVIIWVEYTKSTD